MATMPQMLSAIIMPLGGALPHDPHGKLLGMGNAATALVMRAQELQDGDAMKLRMFKEAMTIRLQERKGWLSVRCTEFPAGDLEGAAQASLAIGTYYLQLHNFDHAHKWLAIALNEAPKTKLLVCFAIKNNMIILQDIMGKFSTTSTAAQSRDSSPVRNNAGDNSVNRAETTVAGAVDMASVIEQLELLDL